MNIATTIYLRKINQISEVEHCSRQQALLILMSLEDIETSIIQQLFEEVHYPGSFFIFTGVH